MKSEKDLVRLRGSKSTTSSPHSCPSLFLWERSQPAETTIYSYLERERESHSRFSDCGCRPYFSELPSASSFSDCRVASGDSNTSTKGGAEGRAVQAI